MRVPTERSKLPDARQKSIVVATMPTVETCSSRFMIFSGEPKFRTLSQHTMISAPKMSCMPARSSKATKDEVDLPGDELMMMIRRRKLFREARLEQGLVRG